MSQATDNPKKVPDVTWEHIATEAVIALAGGRSGVDVPSEEMYRWIEGTEYLTDYGRSPDPSWGDGTSPSYRASLQLIWQRLVQRGKLTRSQPGVYQLTAHTTVAPTDWNKLVSIDSTLVAPQAKPSNATRITRSQALRDGLANYYQTRCQICGSDNTLLIPTDVSDRYYVEVHHIKGLAESYALREQGLLVGFRVNGLGNLVVLCAHHHALVHHLRPVLHFDRANLFWHNQNGTKFLLNTVTPEHANVLKSAS